jgi:hypothetical protein
MNTHQHRWTSAAATRRQAALPDQVVLGHLLPHYQAAVEWQDTVRHERARWGDAPMAKRQGGSGVVTWLRAVARGWAQQRPAVPGAVV